VALPSPFAPPGRSPRQHDARGTTGGRRRLRIDATPLLLRRLREGGRRREDRDDVVVLESPPPRRDLLLPRARVVVEQGLSRISGGVKAMADLWHGLLLPCA
jgi:hypothetical protein